MAILKSVPEDPLALDPTRRLDQSDLGDRYRLRGRLRRAGPPVLLAVDEALGRLVAIKTAADPEATANEAHVLQALDHPGIVRLHERLEINGELWLVLDYVPGDSLEAHLRAEGPLPAEAVRALLSGLTDAVAHIHERGFVHRDLKPANVLIRADGTPVIIDFEAAAPLADSAAPSDTSLLTHGYAAPEQYLKDGLEGPWTDLYALGAIGYTALTGRAPPAAPDRLERGAPLDLPALASMPGLGEALERALALEASERPATAADLQALLAPEQATAAHLDEADEGPPTVRIRRRPGRRPALAVEPVGTATATATRQSRLIPLLVLVALVAAGIVGAFAAWPFYERHVKTTWLVDAAGDGDVSTIGEALARAGDDARIVVRPGTYEESLVVTRAVHLVAAEDGARPVIAPADGPCLLATAPGASLEGFALRGSETAGVACLAISGGDLRVHGTRITATAGPSVEVRAGATPEIRDSAIQGAGLVIREGSQPVVDEVTIEGVEGPSLVVRSGASPEITGNQIEGSGPVVLAEGAGGLLEGNQIHDARTNAIEVASGAAPTVRDNDIVRAGEAGVFVYGDGRGRFEANRIEASALSGVVLERGASVTLTGNQIESSGEHGILVLDGARAVLEDNVLEGSRGRGIAIAPGAEARLEGNDFDGNRSGAVLDARPGTGGGGGGA